MTVTKRKDEIIIRTSLINIDEFNNFSEELAIICVLRNRRVNI